MKWTTVMAGLATLGLSAAGCAKQETPDGTAMLALEGLPGLEARVPAGTQASKNAMGIGVMLQGPDVSVTIGPDLDGDAANLDQAKKNAQAYSPTDLEGETLSDGYVLTYTSEADGRVNYWLVGRRRFVDTAYTCGVSSPKKAHQQTAIAICKSLTKK